MTTWIADVPDNDRVELHTEDGMVGWLDYQRANEVLVLEHTEVVPGQEGHGYAGQLVRALFDSACAEGRRVIVVCPFAKEWLQRHPNYAPLDYVSAPARPTL